jgi:hypothetical protein
MIMRTSTSGRNNMWIIGRHRGLEIDWQIFICMNLEIHLHKKNEKNTFKTKK